MEGNNITLNPITKVFTSNQESVPAQHLTHREIERLCDDFMGKLGWARNSNRELSDKKGALTRPDRVYIKNGVIPLVFEIKPENASTRELARGIGQMAYCLPYQVKPYLVLSRRQWFALMGVCNLLPWLGIITYSNKLEKLKIERKALRDDIGNLVPITIGGPSEIIKGVNLENLTRDKIYYLLRTNKLVGFHTIKELKRLISDAYPSYKIKGSIIKDALHTIGYRRSQRSGKSGYDIPSNLST